MVKRIITISREFGSGGRFIGEEVAKKLGIAYYDKNIINNIFIFYLFSSPAFQDKYKIQHSAQFPPSSIPAPQDQSS